MHPVSMLVDRITDLGSDLPRPVPVAIDGRSDAGKSTLAAQVGLEFGATVIDGDDFYAGGSEAEWNRMSPAEKARHCSDWSRQRPVLEALFRGERASWQPYDWEADDGRLLEHPTVCEPASMIILEGVHSARPELADLFDLRVLFHTPSVVRQRRIVEREGEDHRTEWKARWEEAEEWYFTVVMPPQAFDLVLGSE